MILNYKLYSFSNEIPVICYFKQNLLNFFHLIVCIFLILFSLQYLYSESKVLPFLWNWTDYFAEIMAGNSTLNFFFFTNSFRTSKNWRDWNLYSSVTPILKHLCFPSGKSSIEPYLNLPYQRTGVSKQYHGVIHTKEVTGVCDFLITQAFFLLITPLEWHEKNICYWWKHAPARTIKYCLQSKLEDCSQDQAYSELS